MNCNDIHARLLEFRDAALEEPVLSMIHAHLQTCAACRREWERYGQFDSLLGSLRILRIADNAKWPQEEQPHLDALTLERLAEYSGGPLTKEQRKPWLHVLSCETCYRALIQLRGPNPPNSTEKPPAPELPKKITAKPIVMLIGHTWHLVRQAIGQSLIISKEMLSAGIRLGDSGNVFLRPVSVWGPDTPLSIHVDVPDAQVTLAFSVDPSNAARWRITIKLAEMDRTALYRVGLGDEGRAETGMKTLGAERPETDFFITPSREGFSLCVKWLEDGREKESVVRIPVACEDTQSSGSRSDGLTTNKKE